MSEAIPTKVDRLSGLESGNKPTGAPPFSSQTIAPSRRVTIGRLWPAFT
jgi:hypothetical protein